MLQINNLTTELPAESASLTIVDDVSFTIEKGETYAVVGESGSGKSITAMSLLRLLPAGGHIRRGSVWLAQTDILQLQEWQMRGIRGKRISIIFQDPATCLNPVIRVGEQIVEVIQWHTPLRGHEAQNKAKAWMAKVGLPDVDNRFNAYPFQLSGGQKQRVMIAMALAAEPDVLIADEPTTALDVTIQAQILALLAALQKERGLSILLITHDLAIVAQVAHKVALMYAGQMIEQAPVAQFMREAAHPYAQLLMNAVPSHKKRGQALEAIAGSVPPLSTQFTSCRFADRCDRVHAACHQAHIPMIDLDEQHRVRCVLFKKDQPKPNIIKTKSQQTAQEPLLPTNNNAKPHVGSSLTLSVKNLCVDYPVGSRAFGKPKQWFHAVKNLSFDIAQGQTLALVGESGSGKTTAGKAIMRLLDGRAAISGEVSINGQPMININGKALKAMRRQVQMVFQDPFASLNPRMRIRDILDEGMLSLCPHLTEEDRKTRANTLMQQVGLSSDTLTRYPHEFSGGQRQRIAIARALAVEPALLICDEPTSALDVSVQAQILNLLNQLQKTSGIAIVFITHNIGVVEYVADNIVVMKDGEALESGPALTILNHPQQTYTKTLLASVPQLP